MAPLLDLEHLFDALKGFKRPSSEGREAMKNLVVVGIKKSDAKCALINALCVRTTKIDEDPLTISVLIDKNAKEKEKKISEISCSCPAGASKEHVCKHAFATLLFLERTDEGDLPKLTCTDLEQMWGGLKEQTLSKFQPAPLVEFCHIKKPSCPYKRAVIEVTSEMDSRFRSMYLKDQPSSEAAVFLSEVRAPPVRPSNAPPDNASNVKAVAAILRRAVDEPHYLLKRTAEIGKDLLSKCTPEERKYYEENVVVTEDECFKMCKDTVGQSNDLWMLFKYGRITGSISYSMYTYFLNKKANWNKKFDGIYKSDFAGNEHTKRGLMYEDDGRQCYLQDHPEAAMVNMGIFVHPLVPWAGYSADGVIMLKAPSVPAFKLWECKVPAKGQTKKASEIAPHLSYLDKNNHNLKKRHEYFGQVQLGMALLNLPLCDFSLYCYHSEDMLVVPVPFDETFVRDLLERLVHVYFEKLLPWLVRNNSV